MKLYVHGAPNGQMLWGVGGSNPDGGYIRTFYNNAQTAPSVQMLVEVKQFASNANCYYTYIRKGDIYDHDNRGGSYFAFTIRLDWYYADIRNMYNILDAAYEKYILGDMLTATANGGAKYGISDFKQKDGIIKKLEKELLHYLQAFSSASDFIPLRGFAADGRNEAKKVNLGDFKTKEAERLVRAESKVSVSPLYPSMAEQKAVSKAVSEAEAKIKESNEQMTKNKEKHALEIQKIKQECENRIQDERMKAEQTKKQLAQKLTEKDKTIYARDQDLKKEEACRKSAEKKSGNLLEALASIDKILSPYRGYGGKPKPPRDDARDDRQSREKPPSAKFPMNKLPLLNFFIVIVILFMIMMKNERSPSEDSREFPLDSVCREMSKHEVISVDDVPDSLRSGESCTLKLKINIAGMWNSSNDSIATIEGDVIKPKNEGKATISYVYGNTTIASKEVNVQEKKNNKKQKQ